MKKKNDRQAHFTEKAKPFSNEQNQAQYVVNRAARFKELFYDNQDISDFERYLYIAQIAPNHPEAKIYIDNPALLERDNEDIVDFEYEEACYDPYIYTMIPDILYVKIRNTDQIVETVPNPYKNRKVHLYTDINYILVYDTKGNSKFIEISNVIE